MGLITLPESMERDRQNNIKANSVHVDNNFNALLNAVNNKIDKDGTMTITGNIPMSGHKITGLGTPTMSGDAATLGWVNDYACMLAGSQTISGDKAFTGTTTAVTPSTTDNSTKIATTKFVVDVLKAIYPVGSLYIGTQNTCPMSQFFGTWTLVATDRALWGGNGSNGNSTIAAGLPNIAGNIGNVCVSVSGSGATPAATTGCVSATRTAISNAGNQAGSGRWIGYLDNLRINATNSSSIYGNSSTVQPAAYRVNVWRRTA